MTDCEFFESFVDNEVYRNGISKLIKKINSFDRLNNKYFKFYVDDKVVGLIAPEILSNLLKYSEVFLCVDNKITINPELITFEARTKAIENVLLDMREKKLYKELDGWRNEHYFVRSSFNEKPKFSIERAAASLLGIRSYGCHINGYTKKDSKYFMWIARRSKTKQTYPGMLDNFVAGGLTAGLGVIECAKKELEEEAGVTKEIASKLKQVDSISYAFVKDNGINMEGEFIFDLKLPNDFKPINQDGEVECFYLMNINQVKNAIISDEFKLNSAVVTLSFLFRKGLLNPDELPNYFEIMENMHAPGL